MHVFMQISPKRVHKGSIYNNNDIETHDPKQLFT